MWTEAVILRVCTHIDIGMDTISFLAKQMALNCCTPGKRHRHLDDTTLNANLDVAPWYSHTAIYRLPVVAVVIRMGC